MLRYLTAGESHGQALIATMEGVPSHVRVGVPEIAENLRRRRLGVGRGARMKFEADEVTLLAGFRHGETLGSPSRSATPSGRSGSRSWLRARSTARSSRSRPATRR
jgi:chorismate synthase